MAKYTKKQRKHLKSKTGKKNKTGKRVKRSGKKQNIYKCGNRYYYFLKEEREKEEIEEK